MTALVNALRKVFPFLHFELVKKLSEVITINNITTVVMEEITKKYWINDKISVFTKGIGRLLIPEYRVIDIMYNKYLLI